VLVAGGEEGDGVNMMEQIDQAIGERDRLLAEIERQPGRAGEIAEAYRAARSDAAG